MKKTLKKNKKIRWLITAIFISIIPLLAINFVSAQSYDFNEDSGLDKTANFAGFAIGDSADSVDSIIGQVIFIVLGLVGAVFLGLIILSGIRWMTAQGNEEKVKKAKDGLINSLIGLIIVFAAYALSYFIIGYFT